MDPVLIFRHVECEGPGYLAEFLQRRQLPYSLVCIDRNDPVPESLGNISGLVFMGGGMSVNDDLPWIEPELDLIRQATDKNMPILGHCLGGQLICRALGGEVTKNPVKELGWFPVSQTGNAEPGSSMDWFGQAPQEFLAYHWHGETFSLPHGAVRLLQSDQCENQAFAINNTLAMQCHIEMTADMVREWASLFQDELEKGGSHTQSAKAMCQNLDNRVASLQAVADTVYSTWTGLLK